MNKKVECSHKWYSSLVSAIWLKDHWRILDHQRCFNCKQRKTVATDLEKSEYPSNWEEVMENMKQRIIELCSLNSDQLELELK